MTHVERGFGDGASAPQARFIAATVGDLRVMCAYMPNGESVTSDKYQYKLAWFERLHAYLASRVGPGKTLLLGTTTSPRPTSTATIPPGGRARCSARSPSGKAFEKLLALGFVDSFLHLYPDTQAFSWWDYRMLGFPKNKGLRIDHILVTNDLVPRLTKVWVDRQERKGKQPSDHAPVFDELA